MLQQGGTNNKLAFDDLQSVFNRKELPVGHQLANPAEALVHECPLNEWPLLHRRQSESFWRHQVGGCRQPTLGLDQESQPRPGWERCNDSLWHAACT